MSNWQAIDWEDAPIDDEHRTIAGEARDDAAFYRPENRAMALLVESYLVRYSRAMDHVAGRVDEGPPP